MAKPRPAMEPSYDYDQAQESLYRKQVEDYLYNLAVEVDGVTSGRDKNASAAIKRATMTLPPVGIVRIGS